ncbi:MAG: STAS domain-containing protein [Spirochaetes bacterium]|nr:STAS domain-containing protein [Spirochaetota bacterium]HOJ30151.1 STAS domain-containing protein [Spirochaetota bacterium]HOM11183.1 STAS domain-containing protein [Spirochaetota bacterium]HPP50983.1 STAS domain-containing protein [Spirochaetota bacterium]HXK66489.1 STAS domain-containing protein [Spirochaetota bacterium]
MKVEQRINYGYVIYDITGDITYDNFTEIEDAIKDTLPDNFINVVLNIERVPYINSSALGWLVKLMKEVNAKGYHFFLMNVNQEIMGLLKLTNTLQYFKIIPNEQVLVEKEKKKELDKILNEIEEEKQE